MLLLILGILLPVGLGLLIIGWRGSSVGDDPHCRKCGFNLRGRDPNSLRCPECGTELTGRAIRVGRFERKPGLIWTGGVLTLISLAAFCLGGWMIARDVNWMPWMPTTWLMEDVEKSTGADYANAVAELRNRLSNAGTSQAKVDLIVDRALTHQADRTVKWDRAWANLIADAGAAKRLDDVRARKYLENAVAARFDARPKVRRDQYIVMQFHLDLDRLAENATLRGGWSTSPLKIDSTVFQKDFINQREEHEMGQGTGYGTSYPLHGKEIASVSDGKHQLNSSVECVLRQTAPFVVGPVTVTRPFATPLEIFPAGATIDEFKTEPDQRDAERAAIVNARVTHDSKGLVDVRLRVKNLPRSLAIAVVLKQGTVEQKVGMLVVPGNLAERWYAPYTYNKPKFAGVVEVHLRPDQAASDNLPTLGSYWGEEIVIPGVVVDAPYDPPFNKDESLRPGVIKAIQMPKIERSANGKQLTVNVNFMNSPVKLSYKEILQLNGHEVVINPYGGYVRAGANEGYGTGCDDVDPAHTATECDVIFRPDPEWEKNSDDLTPPWGGEVVLHHVKIETPAAPSTP